eukprot:5051144-Prymnesium_polylepis.1
MAWPTHCTVGFAFDTASRSKCRSTRGAPTSIPGGTWSPTPKPGASGRRDCVRPEPVPGAQRCGMTPRPRGCHEPGACRETI